MNHRPAVFGSSHRCSTRRSVSSSRGHFDSASPGYIRNQITNTRTLAFAFFPNYVGLLSSNTGLRNTATSDVLETLVIAIDGMTCKACAKTLQTELATVSGVTAAEVSYEKRLALVGVPRGRPAPVAKLLVKIKNAGFGGTLVDLQQ